MLIICWLALKKDIIYCFPCFDLSFQRKREQERLFLFQTQGGTLSPAITSKEQTLHSKLFNILCHSVKAFINRTVISDLWLC